MPEQDMNTIPIRRSFERDVKEELKNVSGNIEELTTVRYGSHKYPIIAVQYPNSLRPDHPTVLISGGVHGDEPAGVHSVVDFLRDDVGQHAGYNFICLPCINPSGFEADKRHTMNGKDLNRLFGTGSTQPEIRAIEEYLARLNTRFHITLDLHEDGPTALEEEGVKIEDVPSGCYVYETMVDVRRRIGRVLIDALPPSTEVCMRTTVYDDVNDCGVIAYPEANRNPFYAKGTSFDAYLHEHWTDHTFTTETSMVWPVEKRIAVQRVWLHTALACCLSSRVE